MRFSTRSASDPNNPQVPAILNPEIGSPLIDALAKAGIEAASVQAPYVARYVKIDWEDLCTYETRDKRTTASPQLVITRLDWQPDAEQRYNDYKGLVLIEFVTEFGDEQYVTHAMTYSATGEYLPLSAWLKSIAVPALCRFGRIETSKQNQFIIRPLPIDIEVI